METNTSFTEGKILKPLILFAFPVLLALFLQAMYGAVDLLIVGKFASSADVSAVSTGSQIMTTLTNLISSFAMGTTILLGQQIGSGKKEEGGRTVGTAIVMFAAIAVVMSIIMVVFAPSISQIMNAPEEAFQKTVDYIRICGGGMLVIVAYNLIGCIFRGLGDSKTPLITVAIACVFNIAGDLILCAGFHMGTQGAAIATVFAQIVSVVVSFFLICKKELPFTVKNKNIRIHKVYLKKMVGFGAPIALQDLLVSISFLIILAIVNSMGVIASAGVGVAEKVCAFIMLISSAFMQSMSALWRRSDYKSQKSLALRHCRFFFHWRGNVFDHVFPWRCAGRNFLLGWGSGFCSGRLSQGICDRLPVYSYFLLLYRILQWYR